MEEVKNSFVALDYVVFASMLIVSLGIGVWFAFRGGKQKTQGEYLMANRNMSILPVAISILLSFMSAILILGTPAEMYTQGTEYFIVAFGMFFGVVLAAVLFVPLLYPLKLTSSFEYLERRFNSRGARLLGTVLMILTQVIYIAIATFAPATALEAVTGFPVWGTILSIGAVGTLYTTIGGMKAVIWTDVFQSGVMLAGILAIVIQGIIKVGGISRVWEINEQWGRIKFFNFSPDPTVRHTFWNLIISSATLWMGHYGINQASVQRYSSLPTLRNAKISVMLNSLGVFFLLLLTCLSGIVLFAYYADKNCDPLGQKLVQNSNQLIPYFVMETLAYPGVPGLFIASLFSGALSSVSSSLNALGAITWEDILKPRFDSKLTEYQKTLVTKFIVCSYGVLAMCLSFAIEHLDGTVMQMSASLTGSVFGPLAGMFILGAIFPWANSYGAISGGLFGLGVSMWLSVGSFVYGIRLPSKPFPNGTCLAHPNITMTTTTMASLNTVLTTQLPNKAIERSGILEFYNLSYLWFGTAGTLSVIIVGLVVSFVTGANSIHDVATKYQVPLFSRLGCCLPRPLQNWLNCKREFDSPEVIHSDEKDVEFIIESCDKIDPLTFDKRQMRAIMAKSSKNKIVFSDFVMNSHSDKGQAIQVFSYPSLEKNDSLFDTLHNPDLEYPFNTSSTEQTTLDNTHLHDIKPHSSHNTILEDIKIHSLGNTILDDIEQPTLDNTILDDIEQPTLDNTILDDIEQPTLDNIILDDIEQPTLDNIILEDIEQPTLDNTILDDIEQPTLDNTILDDIEQPTLDNTILDDIEQPTLDNTIFDDIERPEQIEQPAILRDESLVLDVTDSENSAHCSTDNLIVERL